MRRVQVKNNQSGAGFLFLLLPPLRLGTLLILMCTVFDVEGRVTLDRHYHFHGRSSMLNLFSYSLRLCCSLFLNVIPLIPGPRNLRQYREIGEMSREQGGSLAFQS
jgi:hypothetical protein